MLFSKFFTLFSTAVCLSVALVATPAQVILLRHAEKPSSGDSLSKQGFERAAALVSFFTESPLSFEMQVPAALYAQTSSTNHASTRPVQTIALVANQWQLPLYARYTAGDYNALVKEINSTSDYEGRMVMICWEHDNLGNIASAFGVKNAPSWSSSVYDRIWVIDFDGNDVASFQDLPQQLLYGDSES